MLDSFYAQASTIFRWWKSLREATCFNRRKTDVFFLIFVMIFFLELGTRLFFVFCYFGLHRQTHTHSIQTTAHWCRLIMKKKENCTLRYVVCLTPTHVWPTCYLSSSCVENIPPTDSFMITSQHFETHGQEQKDMAIKPSCCLLSHSEI